MKARTLYLLLLFPLGVIAQDLAPESVANLLYNALQEQPGDSLNNPIHSGVLAMDGNRYPVNFSQFRTFRTPGPYSWIKSSANTGSLSFVLGTTPIRLEITFTGPLEGTYRQTANGSNAIITGKIFFSVIPQGEIAPLVNISTRASISPGNPLTEGFVVNGNVPRKVLVRAIGPSLAQFGVPNGVAAPSLSVIGSGGVLAVNDGWGGSSELSAAFSKVGAFALPQSSRDCAILISLTPGNYTAQASAPASGEVLIEVYFVE